MMKIKEIADRLKDKVDFHQPTTIPPDEHHLLITATKVCEELGVEPTAMHIAHVAKLIVEEGIEVKNEYPKMLYHPNWHNKGEEGYGQVTTVSDEEEEEKFEDWRETPFPTVKAKKEKKDE